MDSITRRWVLFICALIALAGAAVAALATTQQRNEQIRGYVDATRTLDLPYRIQRLGINADLTQYSPVELETQLELMAEVGVYWVRQLVSWDLIEPAPGEFVWERWDEVVDAVDQHAELELVAVLVNTPEWARIRSDATLTAPPADVADFAAFVAAFATRYGDSINYYQMWDEPNIRLGWGELQPSAAHYAALLQAGYVAAHSHDPGATVIAAALAPTVETGPENFSELIFLQDLYNLGAAEFADAFAGKPYGFEHPPDDRVISPGRLNFSRLIAMREVMQHNGDGRKALWASAWGWNSLPPDWRGQPSIWGDVGVEEQVQYTLQAIDRADEEWPWLGGMVLSHWQPAVNADDPWWGFALIDQRDQPGSLWQALANRPQDQLAASGHYPPQNPFARYSGIWTFTALGADPGWVNDSRAQFEFAGTDVALIVRQDDSVASLYASVDNQPANALPRDPAGNAFLLLRSGDLRPDVSVVSVARNLDGGIHTLEITADKLVPDDPVQRWPLAGYAVSSGDLAAPYNRQIAIAWVTTIIAAVCTVVTGVGLPWRTYARPLARYWNIITSTGQIVLSTLTSLALLGGMLLTYYDGIPTLFRRDPVNLLMSIVTAGFIYWNNFGPVLTLLAALVLFVMIYNRLELGVLLSVFFAPFFLFPVELYRFAFPMVEILIMLTSSAWMLRLLVHWGQHQQIHVSQFGGDSLRELVSKLHVMDYFVLVWIGLGLVSLAWAEYQAQAITELRVLIVEPALLYGVLRYTIRDREAAARLVSALLLAGVAVAVAGLIMFVRGEQIITAEAGARRLASVYGSPNNVGLFLGRCVPFALAFLLVSPDRRGRLLGGLAALVMLTAIALSQSAGAIFLGVPATIALVLILHWRKRAWIPLGGLLVVGLLSLALASQMPRFARALDLNEGTNFYRVRVWQSAVNMIVDRPVTGWGLDQFLYAFRGTYIMPDAWEEPGLSHPHNIVLDQWVRLGLGGVGLLGAMLYVFWRRLLRLYRQLVQQQDRLLLAMSIGVLGSMFNLLIHGLVDHSIYVIDLAVVFVLLLALAVNLPHLTVIDASKR